METDKTNYSENRRHETVKEVCFLVWEPYHLAVKCSVTYSNCM